MTEYVELHCHSNFSFREGASTVEELIRQALVLGYPALAVTDHDNLSGAMRFARKAIREGLKPITGAEITLAGQSHLTLLAATPVGYSNLCNLLSFARYFGDRQRPELDPSLLPEHAEGLVLLTGCPRGAVSRAVDEGRMDDAIELIDQYREWFGEDGVFLELQQNLVRGDTARIKHLVALGRNLGVPLVATNNVHYHVKERHRLQDCLVAASLRKSLEGSHRERRPNAEFYLKSFRQMARLFSELPESLANTLAIAERCEFNIKSDLTYKFPESKVPEGFNQTSHLEHLCRQAAMRKYGHITDEVNERLIVEIDRIRSNDLAGFLLIYREIIGMAREVQVDLGLVDPEIPIEEAPPGRGRGSSVASLVCYLLGLSHIDPLKYNLGLDRFLPTGSQLTSAPDIDLDFPRGTREELIKRVHEYYGWQHAALTGATPTYHVRSAIRDLGLALNLPSDQINKLAKQTEGGTAQQVREEMLAMPDFRDKIDAPIWRDLIELAGQLDGFPRGLSQHPGGMLISSTPLIDQVPIYRSAIEGRYVCQWDRDAIDDAHFVKIDFLALGALSQMQEAVRLIQERTGRLVDFSSIGFDDKSVYEMLRRADTIGIFQVESAAQLQTIARIRPENLTDMAYEVAAVRPGVGVNDGVSEYIRRREEARSNPDYVVPYDHPLEEVPLKRTLGIVLFQDQFNQLAVSVANFPQKDADEFRRAYLRADEAGYIESYWKPRFMNGAKANGVGSMVAERIFKKFNGQYMFPEAHAYAFGATAYHMSWLKYYYPLEFYVSLFNEQPMGFYNLETLKEDAKRHAVTILHPDVNRSYPGCIIEDETIRLGLLNVESVGQTVAKGIIEERSSRGPFMSLADFMARTGVRREILDNLADAGALDLLTAQPSDASASTGQSEAQAGASVGRRTKRWEIGLRYRPPSRQLALALPMDHVVPLKELTPWERMQGEYRTMGVHPEAHLMAYMRDHLPGVMISIEMRGLAEGSEIEVAGLVIRRQRPLAKAVFITLEDEFGHIPIIIWPKVYRRYRHVIKDPILRVKGTVSRRDNTINMVMSHAEPISVLGTVLPRSKNWG